MSTLDVLSYLEPLFCLLVLTALVRARAVKAFGWFFAFLLVRLGADLVGVACIKFSSGGMERHFAYRCYFYVYWTSYAVEAILQLMVVLGVFKLAMAPLKGLQTLGMLVFKWAGAISIAVAISITLAPHQSGTDFMVAMFTQVQQTSSILILCLLLFVCFAVRPMGLSYRSRIFGVSLGLGMTAATSLVASAWMRTMATLDSSINIVAGFMGCFTLLLWSAYFTLPEEQRKLILLPTTSPFLRWNQISEVLGDSPGFVAIAGIPPEMFAPAEVEVMRRASAKMPPDGAAFVPDSNTITLESLIA